MQNKSNIFSRLKLLKKSNYDKHNSTLKKNLGLQLMSETYGYSDIYNYNPQDIYQPREKLTFRRRNELFIDCAILRTVIDKVNKEIHRKGLVTKSDFVRKCRREHIEPCDNYMHRVNDLRGLSPLDVDCNDCPNENVPLGQDECGEEYQTSQIRCNDCRMPTRNPDIMQKRRLRKILKGYVNNQNQTMLQVTSHVNIDVEKHDNGYFINRFIYTWSDDENGRKPISPTRKTWVQTYRGNPERIRPVIRKEGDLSSHYYTCINHRDMYVMHSFNEYSTSNKILLCEADIGKNELNPTECKQPLQRVYYVQIRQEGAEHDVVYCYIKGEVVHVKKYFPAGAMGISLIDSLYYSILQLIGMEKWIAEYYLKMRMFKGFFTVPNELGGTGESLQRLVLAEFMKWRQDPYYSPIFGIPKDSKDMKYNRIDDKPTELQLIENRQESRTQVANAYGMSNVWMNDSSAGAGLNNQGIELMITNRHIDFGQMMMETQGLQPVCASILDIEIDELEYYIGYPPHEEQDLMAEKQRRSTEIANARSAQELGVDVYLNDKGEYDYSSPIEGRPLVPMAQQMTNTQPYQSVEGMSERGLPYERRAQSNPFEGSPNNPRVEGSGITVKNNGGQQLTKQKLDLKITPAFTKDVFDLIDLNKNSGLFELQYTQIIELIDNHICLVAKDGEHIIGYVFNMFDTNTNRIHLISIAVDKNYQKKGVGKALIEGSKAAIPMMSMSGLYLEVRESNTSAISLYKKTGFVEKEHLTDFYPDGEIAVLMEYSIHKDKKAIEVTFKDEYNYDYDESYNYRFDRFETVKHDDVIIPDDYGVTDHNQSTITYFLEHPKNIPAITVCEKEDGLYLLDGFHRLMVLKLLKVDKVRVAVVVERDSIMTPEELALYKEIDPDFEDKHPRDEGGRFAAKPSMDTDTGGGVGGAKPAAEAGQAQPEAARKPKKVPTDESGVPSTDMEDPSDAKQKPQGDILSHLMEFGGFILDQDLSYYPGGGILVGIPFKPQMTLTNEVDSEILISMIKRVQNIISQIPYGEYVIFGWIQDEKVYVGMGEIHADINIAMESAKTNRELEIWDFDNNHAVIVKSENTNEEIVYDFLVRRGRYWESKTHMPTEEYISKRD